MDTIASDMNPTARTCPSCRQPLPADAPQGLCPQCLAKSALGSQPGGEETIASGSKPGGSGPATIQPEIARLFPQLEIMEPLGQGGMGMVYKARQPQLDRIVALKVMRADLSRDPAFAERFAREARALAKLNHPNIVSVFDFGQSGGHCWILMEFVDGTNLRELLRTKTLQPREALGIVPKVCDALQYAHDEGIVHRDIKPENILLDKKGRVKIADFGLAKLVGKDASEFSLTATGMTLGTPRYMAPEQFDKPQEVDHRADIYSLGVVLYEMLTGEVPMGRFSLPSATIGVDVRLDEIVLRTLEKEPSRRYQHASEVKTQVESIASAPQAAQIPPAAGPVETGSGALLLLDETDRTGRRHQHITMIMGMLLIALGLVCMKAVLPLAVALGVLGVFFLIAAGRVRQQWEVDYLGHAIRFENSVFFSGSLKIDGDTVGSGGVGFQTELSGRIPRGSGAGHRIVAKTHAGLLSFRCQLFVEPKACTPAREMKTQVESIAGVTATLPPMLRQALGWEYKSKTELFGLPLVHIASGVDLQTGKARVAKGIIAIGGVAKGVLAFGGASYGVFAFGGFAVGLFTCAGCGIGLVSIAGLAVALTVAYGGLAVAPVALGGLAVGYYAFGGGAFGVHALGGNANDPVARTFFSWVMVNWKYVNIGGLVLMAVSFLVPMVATIYARGLALRKAEADGPGSDPNQTRAMATNWRGLIIGSVLTFALCALITWLLANDRAHESESAARAAMTPAGKVTKPDFSGTWKLQSTETSEVFTYEHREPALRVIMRLGGDALGQRILDFSGQIDRQEHRQTVEGQPASLLAWWEGEELLLEIKRVVNGGVILSRRRMKVSPDGKTITAERTILSPGPERGWTEIWERQDGRTGSSSVNATAASAQSPQQPIIYTFSGLTHFTRGPDGPQLLKSFADELKLNELQTAEVNKIIPRYYRDFVALERQHTTFNKDATGQVQITITPFAEDTIALAKRMNAEIRGTIGKEILYPDLPGNLVLFGLFRHCGQVEIKTRLWKEGSLYRFEEKHGTMKFPGGGTRSGASRANSGKDWKWAFPEEYWIYWSEK